MVITCPNCAFSRDVPPEKMPAHSVVATCPKCSCRFRFSPAESAPEVGPGTGAAPSPRKDTPQDADDPLPPGAVVPGRDTIRESSATGREDEDAAENSGVSRDGQGQASAPARAGARGDKAGEDMRLAASRAYSREAARFDVPEEETGSPAGNPWAVAPAPYGWFAAFYQTVLCVMFAAPRFFGALKPQPRPLRALGFYLLVGVAQIVLERFWGYMLLQYMSAGGPPADPQLAKLLDMLAPQANLAMTVLLRTGLLVLELYFFSAIIHLAYRFLAPDRADFSLVFQVIAYSAAPSLLCVIPLIGSLAGFVWSLSCITAGCRISLRLSWGQTLTGFAPACLAALMFLTQFMRAVQG
ncbi:MAG: zinc-ribbon domain-containing protein [Desulfovibrio sp.]|nr:zinc-ribbon domain-containing protein [Desulfovibrio sp.]